jgi:hypothetical protein
MDKLIRIVIRIIRCIILCIVFIAFPFFAIGQGLNIKSGATLINRGNLILKGNWINDGSFIDTSGIVIFSGTAQTISGTVPSGFSSLTVSGTSSTTITTAGQTISRILLCNGTLNTAGYITLLSTSSRTALVDGSGTGSINGNVTMQRYFPSGFGYKYVSSPFQAATVSEWGDDIDLGTTFPMFYRYDESRTSSGWVSHNLPADTLVPLHGYAANMGSSAVPNTVDVTGIVNTGALSRTVFNHDYTYTQGFNLIGNPFPSPIDWDAASGWTKTNIDNALYYFKASTTDQWGGTYGTYINGVSSDSMATNIIPSMQGFFIHVTDGSYPVTGTLSLNNNVRITNLTHPFLKSSQTGKRQLIHLTATFTDDKLSKDPLVIYFDDNADTIFNSQLDALKLLNTDFNVANLYTTCADGKKLSIRALPMSFLTGHIIPVGLIIYRNGNISFRISSTQNMSAFTEAYLYDKETGINKNLLPGNDYTVSLDAGEYSDRFFLAVNAPLTGITKYESIEDLFRVYYSGGMIIAEIDRDFTNKSTLMITNLTGQQVFIKTIPEPGHYQFNPELVQGIYIVTFISGTRKISRKVFIDN